MIKPNARILQHITNRIEARTAATDPAGLRAIIAACENGLELARAALEGMDPNPAPQPVTTQPETPDSTPANLNQRREESEQEKYERKILEEMERADTSKLYGAIREQGGIHPSSSDLAEEYRVVPPCYRNPQGMFGDVMAEHLATHMPELGIQDENDLLQFFADRSTRSRNRHAAA